MARTHQKQQTWPHTLAAQASARPWQVVQQLAAVGKWRAVAACLFRVLGLSAVWQLQVGLVVQRGSPIPYVRDTN